MSTVIAECIMSQTVKYGLGVAVLSALFLSQSAVFGQSAIRWHDDIQLGDLSALPQRMVAAETPDTVLTLTNEAPRPERKTVRTCAEYLAAVDAGFDAMTTRDINNEARFVRDCFLLRDLRNARSPT